MDKQKKKVKRTPSQKERDKKAMDKELDKKLKDTFPASDSTAEY